MESNTAPLLEMRGIKKDFFGNQVLTDINFTLKRRRGAGPWQAKTARVKAR